MSLRLRSILSAVTGRTRRTGSSTRAHRVRTHTRGTPRGRTAVVREYRRRNRA